MKPETRKVLYDNLGSLPAFIKNELPETYEKIGNILIVNLPQKVNPYKKDIGAAYKKAFGVKTVLLKGKIYGEYRIPDFDIIAGSDTETIHKENGVLYKLDLLQVMFSSGNINERIRMATLPRNEKVVDMFAGIGYFTLPVAVHCHSRVDAVEKNGYALNYLRENIALNSVQNLVTPYHMDCREYTGCADRVIMGHPDAHLFLETAFDIVKTGVIHYHEFTPESRFDRPVSRITKAAQKAGCTIRIDQMHKIKKYAPGVWHMVYDICVV
ncbi:MAG: class I SAM-dependent methyltransferase family protein [Candidatus Methanofastidiosia archaeon]|jgi:tRNA wybutosine-synthesizing protein 2